MPKLWRTAGGLQLLLCLLLAGTALLSVTAIDPPRAKTKILVDMRFLAKFDIMPLFT
jgi:hypothetical protein